MKNWLTNHLFQGFVFALLWSSASVAGKYGLLSVEPLLLFNVRFVLAGIALMAVVYLWQSNRLPNIVEFKRLTIFSTFNTVLYLGFFILALEQVAAGITTLAVALNPLFISLMTAIYSRKSIRPITIISIIMGTVGVGLAAYPLLQTSYASISGLLFLALSMLAYSFGSVYFASVKWELPRLVINAWQVLIAGFILVPFTIIFHQSENNFDTTFWLSELWLVVMVSIFAVQLWLRLLRTDAVRASLWLYLCPIFGFAYATILLDEPFSIYTILGTILVIGALYIGQRKSTFKIGK